MYFILIYRRAVVETLTKYFIIPQAAGHNNVRKLDNNRLRGYASTDHMNRLKYFNLKTLISIRTAIMRIERRNPTPRFVLLPERNENKSFPRVFIEPTTVAFIIRHFATGPRRYNIKIITVDQ